MKRCIVISPVIPPVTSAIRPVPKESEIRVKESFVEKIPLVKVKVPVKSIAPEDKVTPLELFITKSFKPITEILVVLIC